MYPYGRTQLRFAGNRPQKSQPITQLNDFGSEWIGWNECGFICLY